MNEFEERKALVEAGRKKFQELKNKKSQNSLLEVSNIPSTNEVIPQNTFERENKQQEELQTNLSLPNPIQELKTSSVPSSPNLEIIDQKSSSVQLNRTEIDNLRNVNTQLLQKLKTQQNLIQDLTDTRDVLQNELEKERKLAITLKDNLEIMKIKEEERMKETNKDYEIKKLQEDIEKISLELRLKDDQLNTLKNEMISLENKSLEKNEVIEQLKKEKVMLLQEIQKRMDKVFESTIQTVEISSSPPPTPKEDSLDASFLYFWSKP